MLQVLIVEPDTTHLNSIKAIIQDRKMDFCRIQYESDVSQVVELFRQNQFDVLISEISSPIMSGKEIFEYVEMVSPETVKIAMAKADHIPEVVFSLYEMHPYRVILKPVNVLADIMDPIKEAKVMLDLKAREASFEEEQEQNLRKTIKQKEKELVGKQLDLETQFLFTLGVVSYGMQRQFVEQPDAHFEKIQDFFKKTQQACLKFIPATWEKRAVHFTELLNTYNKKDEHQLLSLRISAGKTLPDLILQRILISIAIVCEAYHMLFLEYAIEALIDEDGKRAVLRVKCDFTETKNSKGELIYTETDEFTKKKIAESIHLVLGLLGKPAGNLLTGECIIVYNYAE